jgi:hypothetical protein
LIELAPVRRIRGLCGVILILAPFLSSLQGQSPAASDPPAVSAIPHVTFVFERKGLAVPKYQLTVNKDTSGAYQGEVVQHASGAGVSAEMPPQPFDRKINISGATTERIFKLADQLDHFNKTCASKAKNIADSGTKTLTYSGPDGTGSCTYNYSELKDVQALTDIFQAIAETMDQGRELDHLRRFDRLGLDAALKALSDELAGGRAMEIGTIATSLHSIVTDPEVMERVRTRASAMLAQINSNSSSR